MSLPPSYRHVSLGRDIWVDREQDGDYAVYRIVFFTSSGVGGDFSGFVYLSDGDSGWAMNRLGLDTINEIETYWFRGTDWENGGCEILKCKPAECRYFPHTDKPDRLESLLGVLSFAEECPVVFETLERLKEALNNACFKISSPVRAYFETEAQG